MIEKKYASPTPVERATIQDLFQRGLHRLEEKEAAEHGAAPTETPASGIVER